MAQSQNTRMDSALDQNGSTSITLGASLARERVQSGPGWPGFDRIVMSQCVGRHQGAALPNMRGQLRPLSDAQKIERSRYPATLDCMIQSVPLLAGAISKEDIDPTPTSMTGFTLSRCPQYHRALTEAHASSGSFKATAAHFPQNAWASFVDDKTASFRKSRFSVGAFQPGSDRAIDDASDEDKACRRFSALRSAPIRRNISVNSDVATKDPNKTGEPPNAFEQLRYCCEASL